MQAEAACNQHCGNGQLTGTGTVVSTQNSERLNKCCELLALSCCVVAALPATYASLKRPGAQLGQGCSGWSSAALAKVPPMLRLVLVTKRTSSSRMPVPGFANAAAMYSLEPSKAGLKVGDTSPVLLTPRSGAQVLPYMTCSELTPPPVLATESLMLVIGTRPVVANFASLKAPKLSHLPAPVALKGPRTCTGTLTVTCAPDKARARFSRRMAGGRMARRCCNLVRKPARSRAWCQHSG